MSSDTIAQLQTLCGAALPASWLRLMQSYPELLRTALRADDGSDDDGTVSGVELLADPFRVLFVNQEVRSGTVLDPEGREFRWPDRLLVIGETGDGDYYCLDTDGDYAGVLQFRHLTVQFDVITDSLDEFVQLLCETYVTEEPAESRGPA